MKKNGAAKADIIFVTRDGAAAYDPDQRSLSPALASLLSSERRVRATWFGNILVLGHRGLHKSSSHFRLLW